MYPYAPILPNEHLTGYLGRLYALSARSTFFDTVRDFDLNVGSIYPHPLYRTISPKLLDKAGIQSIETAWLNHTLTLYGLPFLTRREQEAVRTGAVDSPDYPNVIGQNLIKARSWRWCDQCVNSDIHNYGTSFYHRDHQIPGVYHCPLHGKRLYEGCGSCGFKANSLKTLPIPPLDNSCPSCKATLAPASVFFSDEMAEIESISVKLCRTRLTLTIEDITQRTFATVGVSSQSTSQTAADRRTVSRWYKKLIETSDPMVLNTYFTGSPTKTNPGLLRRRGLFSAYSNRERLHPLAYLFVLQNRGINLQQLFGQ